MITSLHHMPDLWVFYILTVPFVLAVICVSVFAHRVLPFEKDEGGFEIMDAFIAVSSAAAVVLAFSLVQVDTTYRMIEDNIAREADAMNTLDRAMARYGDQVLGNARVLLIDYAKALKDEEWPLLSVGGRSDQVEKLYDRMSDALRTLEPKSEHQIALFNEALEAIDRIWDLRELRLEASKVGLPPLFWKAVLAMFAILVVISSQTEPTRKRVTAMASIAATLGLLLSLVVIIDAPFAGETPISAEEIETAINSMMGRK